MEDKDDFVNILANALGCKREAVVDRLFPIEKGYSEKERIININAIYDAMAECCE